MACAHCSGMRAVTLAIVLALARPTHAHADDDEPRSPAVATWLSIGVTAGGAAVGAAAFAIPERRATVIVASVGFTAFIVGPSVGHWYGGNFREGPGGWMRGGGLAIGFVGFFALAAECDDEDDTGVCDSPRRWPVAAAMFGVGAALFVAGAAYDIATAAGEARRYNRNRNAWSLAPVYGRGTSGIALAGRF
jgi:hypothetical protein